MTTFFSAVRALSQAGMTMRPIIRTGPSTVTTTNHLVRTRSRNSRRATTNHCAMSGPRSGPPGLGRAGLATDPVDKDLMKRGLEQLEPAQGQTLADQRCEQAAGGLGSATVGVGDQLD